MTEKDLKMFREKRREVKLAKRMLQSCLSDLGYPIIDPSDARSKSNKSVSSVESAADRKLQLHKRYMELLEAYDSEAVSIEDALNILTLDEASVIRAYYIHGYKWADVCEVLNFSWSQIQRLKKSAIQKLAAYSDRRG